MSSAADILPSKRNGPSEAELADAWLRDLGLNEARLTGPPPIHTEPTQPQLDAPRAYAGEAVPSDETVPSGEGLRVVNAGATSQRPDAPTGAEPVDPVAATNPTEVSVPPDRSMPAWDSQPGDSSPPAVRLPLIQNRGVRSERLGYEPETVSQLGPALRPDVTSPTDIESSVPPVAAPDGDGDGEGGPVGTGPFAQPPKVSRPVPKPGPPTTEAMAAPAQFRPVTPVPTAVPQQPTSVTNDLAAREASLHAAAERAAMEHAAAERDAVDQANAERAAAAVERVAADRAALAGGGVNAGDVTRPEWASSDQAIAGHQETVRPLPPRVPATVPAPGAYPPPPAPAVRRRRRARRASVSLPALVVLALATAFFAWVSAEPFWLAVGHGHSGTATFISAENGCRASFVAADGSLTASTVEVAGVRTCPIGASASAHMVSARAERVYVTDQTGLNARWSIGFGLIILCGLAVAAATGAGRVPGWRGTAAAALSLIGPVVVTAVMLALAY